MESAPPRATADNARPWWLRLRKRAGRIRRRFAVDTYDIFVRPVTDDSAAFAPPEGYRFALGTAEDVERCDPYHTELDERERRLGIVRLELGHLVVMAFDGDVPVFTMWANPRHLNVPGLVKRRLHPHQWFIYKAFTSPDHRGRGLYEAGMRFVLSEMERRGLTELVGYAHTKKRISRKGLAALRFESVGRVVQYRAPGLLFTRERRDLVQRFPTSSPRSRALSGEEGRQA